MFEKRIKEYELLTDEELQSIIESSRKELDNLNETLNDPSTSSLQASEILNDDIPYEQAKIDDATSVLKSRK